MSYIIKQISPLLKDIDKFLEIFGKNKNFSIELDITKIDFKLIKIFEQLIQSIKDYPHIFNIFYFKFDIDLSSGEENFLFQFSNFYHSLISSQIKENLLILIDEGETTLHPEWQKRYINYYIDFLKDNFPDTQFSYYFNNSLPISNFRPTKREYYLFRQR